MGNERNEWSVAKRIDLYRSACVLAFFLSAGSCLCGQDAEITVHGPFITWHTDPLTTANIVWVESPAGSTDTFVAGSWSEGPAGFGFGDDDDKTELKEMAEKFARVYIRKNFKLDSAARKKKAYLQIRYDDAFIAYLNGREVLRKSVGRGAGADAKDIESHEAKKDEFDTYEIDKWTEFAREGDNVLAIEGHNRELTSSDFTLDPYLTSDKSKSSPAYIDKHATWYYMANGEPSRAWMTLDFPELRSSPRAVPPKPVPPPRTVSTDSRGVVWVRRAGTSQWQEQRAAARPFGKTDNTVFQLRLTGLTPDTIYEFGIQERPDDSKKPVLHFRTAPAQPGERFRFVTGGDMGSTKVAREMTTTALKLQPTFALIGGDLAYANGKNLKAWHNWIDDWRTHATASDGFCLPMVLAIGNHETGSGLSDKEARELRTHKNAMFYYSLFPLPDDKPYYALDFAKYLSIIVLDSNHTVSAEDQAAWLDQTLAARHDRGHLFVCYHKPTWGTAKDPDMEVRRHWVPLFESHPVTAVFENDHHTLKRSHRLLQGKVDPQGVLYLGDGAWGVETRDVPKPGERDYLAHAASENHIWVVDIAGKHVKYRAVDEHGKLLDEVAY